MTVTMEIWPSTFFVAQAFESQGRSKLSRLDKLSYFRWVPDFRFYTRSMVVFTIRHVLVYDNLRNANNCGTEDLNIRKETTVCIL